MLTYDAHHGNGTQDVFYSDPNVLFISLHQMPLYPWTGAVNERGIGDGIGTTLNIPLRPGLLEMCLVSMGESRITNY
ncbi:MAG: hypothetical protein CM15mP49_24000 [Actinomycetota bacterium]|nr:MAG: hypothetical protein CM15mP49_24000 [Actinomycetota bacterium]